MKSPIILMAIGLIALAACSNQVDKSGDTKKKNSDTLQKMNPVPDATSSSDRDTKLISPIKSILANYFDLKNALTNDDGKQAAAAGKAIVETMNRVDTSLLSPDQNQAYKDLKDDMRENAEHIGENGDKIEHQREHFELLSRDIYALIKLKALGQTAYLDNCPMYNKGKGANWISEIKEIRNPYLGKKMETCGSIKDELK